MSAPPGRPAATPSTEVGYPWSFRVGTLLGIPIRVHVTFLLLVVFFAFLARSAQASVLGTIVVIVLVFACVVFHELGHATMARRFGVQTREIVLFPIGGVARLENIPGGKAEILIALAGPAVNFVLVFVLLGLAVLLGPGRTAPTPSLFGGASVIEDLIRANLVLFLFNLIPAFPMDGGRVFRAVLSLGLPDDRATRIASIVAQIIALGFGALGLFGGNPLLVFIALFVFLAAGHEAASAAQKAIVLGHVAREAMMTRFETLAPQDKLGRAAELLLDTYQEDFPVVDAWNRVSGVLSRSALLRGMAQAGHDAPVLEVMDREPAIVGPEEDLEIVLGHLQSRPGRPVLVVDGERLVGVVTIENLAEFIQLTRNVERAPA